MAAAERLSTASFMRGLYSAKKYVAEMERAKQAFAELVSKLTESE
jgi:RES domain-containing protein